MKITSPEFEEGKPIPSKFTCDGEHASPELHISDIPPGAKTLALIMDDPDAPGGTYVHWVMFNIPPTDKIAENGAPGTQGVSDYGKQTYGGPCPPSGTHRYFFKLYALDTELPLQAGCTKKDLESAMEGHILEKTALMGTYSAVKLI